MNLRARADKLVRQLLSDEVEEDPPLPPIRRRGETMLIPLGYLEPVNDHRWSIKGDALPPPCQMMFNGKDCTRRAEVAVKRPDVVSIFYFCEEHAEKFR